MPDIILDYKASVPSSTVLGAGTVTIPQAPNLLMVADLGIFISEVTPPTMNRVMLSGDLGVRSLGPLFNNVVGLHVYRDGVEVFNSLTGLQIPAGGTTFNYNIVFHFVDEFVPTGFHVYQFGVNAFIQTVQSSTQVIGPITFSGLAVGTY